MAEPSRSIVKRIYAVSGNRCAFPNCTIALVEPQSGKVTGRICHIKGKNKKGPRYDDGQSDEERHGFDNLLLMCPIHHDVIDDDPDSYTVEWLLKIKSAHERLFTSNLEVSDSIANSFIANITNNTINHGSFIFVQNQSGGQVAHCITNIGPQPRTIAPASYNVLKEALTQPSGTSVFEGLMEVVSEPLIAELTKLPPMTIEIFCVMGDSEAIRYGNMLMELLRACGWTVKGLMHAIYQTPFEGINIFVNQITPSYEALAKWFQSCGLKTKGVHDANRNDSILIIGANL